MNANNFFREATLRICGSLRIEEALHRSLLFLQEQLPVKEIALINFDPGKETDTINVHADNSGGYLTDLEVLCCLSTLTADQDEALIVNKADKHTVTIPILKAMGKGRSSILFMRLVIEQTWVGYVILWAPGWDRFNEEHLRLLKQLKQPFSIALSNSSRYREVLELKALLVDDNRYLQEELQQISGNEIIGADFGLKGVIEKVRQVASLNSPVLLLGETGVGKEVIACAIHNASSRRDGPFIKVNCGAIPETLMDSELFGHEKGAFTGAIDRKRGRFERAHGGTIFLDEIGELQPDAQVRLLRVLQEKEIERIGGDASVQVDIRVIAATHRNLKEMIKKGRFREDLYYRLQVFPINIPPLRERTGDIPSLVHHFIQKKSRELKLPVIPALSPSTYNQLLAYHWPGNVRELENAVERTIIQNRTGPLSFTAPGPGEESSQIQAETADGPELYNLDMVTAKHIRRILKLTKGRVEGKEGAAELLGLKPGTLRHRMRKLSIEFGRKVSSYKDIQS